MPPRGTLRIRRGSTSGRPRALQARCAKSAARAAWCSAGIPRRSKPLSRLHAPPACTGLARGYYTTCSL